MSIVQNLCVVNYLQESTSKNQYKLKSLEETIATQEGDIQNLLTKTERISNTLLRVHEQVKKEWHYNLNKLLTEEERFEISEVMDEYQGIRPCKAMLIGTTEEAFNKGINLGKNNTYILPTDLLARIGATIIGLPTGVMAFMSGVGYLAAGITYISTGEFPFNETNNLIKSVAPYFFGIFGGISLFASMIAIPASFEKNIHKKMGEKLLVYKDTLQEQFDMYRRFKQTSEQ